MTESGKTKGKIVVGVDGTPASRAALRWAIDEARCRGDRVHVVYAWGSKMVAETHPHARPAAINHESGEAARVLDYAVSGLVDTGEDDVEIEREVVESAPSTALLTASLDAELLVVGSRGHSAFANLFLGSVSHDCAAHAPCPVVLVHSEEEQERRADRIAAAAGRVSRSRR
jgi:nucleotide-binding universal stress UspA family protein